MNSLWSCEVVSAKRPILSDDDVTKVQQQQVIHLETTALVSFRSHRPEELNLFPSGT
jgi:hypothetical protein